MTTLVNLTRELVAIPTHEGEAELQRVLASYLRELGFAVSLMDVLPGRPNLIATRGEGGPLLCSHADAFPPYRHPDPFTLRQEGDLLIGRAVNDTKGQIAALLQALEFSTGPCEVMITVDEERLGRGSLALEPRSAVAVVLEPTDLAICPVQAGFLECELLVAGRPAHETVPTAGENAILKAIAAYQRVIELPFLQREHPFLGGPWTTLGTIAGGDEIGMVPERCTITFDLGIWPGVNLDAAEGAVRSVLTGDGFTLTVRDRSDGYELATDHWLVDSLRAAVESTGQRARLGGMPSWTDAQNLVQKGIPSVVFGAGSLGTAHSDRESVRLSDLETLARALATFIDDFPRSG